MDLARFVGCQLVPVFDISGSMSSLEKSTDLFSKAEYGGRQSRTRLDAAKAVMRKLHALMSAIDPDGLDVILFNDRVFTYKVSSIEQLDGLLGNMQPGGTTNTAGALDAAFRLHLAYRQQNGFKATIVLVFTDGRPNSEDEVKNQLIAMSQNVGSDTEIGVSFIQIGDDKSAAAFLKRMDNLVDEVPGLEMDIVDTKPLSVFESDRDVRDVLSDVFTQALTD